MIADKTKRTKETEAAVIEAKTALFHALDEKAEVEGGRKIEDMMFSAAQVSQMTRRHWDAGIDKGRELEQEEIVCRLLASGMPAEEISVVIKIRIEDVRIIEGNNSKVIADYAKKLKARRKYREKQTGCYQ